MATVLMPEPQWRVAGPGRLCRGHRCRRPAVLEMTRGARRPSWWAYCADHAYGRVLLDDGIYYAYEPEQEALVGLFGEEGDRG